MKADKVTELLREYSDCPECGNHYIGNGEGTLLIDGNMFIRTCKCGFGLEINEDILK